MKFSDGYWNMREGIKAFNATQVCDVRIEKNRATVYAACKAVVQRGDTLNEPLLTIRYSSPMPDVICVRVEHFRGQEKHLPEFVLNTLEPPVSIENNEKSLSFTSGKLKVNISKAGNFKSDFFYGNKRLTGSGYRTTGCIKDSSQNVYVREQLDIDVGECVYGLGERFTGFVKNGQTVDIWNEDGGTCTEQSYKNIPFYITNRGYGVFINHPERVSLEVGSEVVSKVQFSVPGEYIEYFVIGGENLKDVLKNYTTLTGKPALPPAWSFGLWLTTSFTTSYDEATVNSFVDGMRERDIPLHVFHFDCFWMKEYQWCDFKWDNEVFPDPESMLKRLKEKGLKICVWINPYIAQKSYLFEEGMKNGYLVRKRDGSVWQWDNWQAGMALVDFTNPGAVSWFKEKLKALVDMGVDCFKTDFGERIPTEVVYFDRSDPIRMHNYYTYLYNKTVFELLKETRGAGEAALFARSATVGGQQFPVHWGGDCSANYPSMAETLRGGLSLCLSGFGFWSHDISGFESTATPDIYKRWAAFGLLSTHSRLHGNSSYRVPWLFDEEAVEVLRYFTKLKCSLMPYLYSASLQASQEGIPVMRAMVLEFTEDPACSCLDRQYMLGGDLLVAPIFNEEGMASYYLPRGNWTNFITGKKAEGGCWIEEKYDYMGIPLMVRQNSIIAVGNVDTKPDYDYAEGVTFHIFELQDGAETEALVYNTEGEQQIRISAACCKECITIEADTLRSGWRILLRGTEKVSSVEGGSCEATHEGVLIVPSQGIRHLCINL